MAYRADVVGYDAQRDVVLVVEVKARPGASPAWAAQFRRNLLSHGHVRNAMLFLIALPDCFYLWTGTPDDDVETPPGYAIDPQPFLQPCFAAGQSTMESPLDRVRREQLRSRMGSLKAPSKTADTC